MGPVRQNPIQRTVSLFICVCIALCTIVAHNIAQNRPDQFSPLPSRQSPLLGWCLFEGRWKPPQQLRQQTSNCSSILIYRPRKDERLCWPSWLTYSGWLTHISGHPSATSRAQDSESTSAKDQCSTSGPLLVWLASIIYQNFWFQPFPA